MKQITVPAFESEGDEIRWWQRSLDAVEENLAEAVQFGTARRGTTARILGEARKGLTGVFRHVSIRILEDDLEQARLQAREKGMTHQNYIAALLHEALAKRRKR